MTAPKVLKRKAEEADIEGETCTKNPRTTRQDKNEGNTGDDGVDPWARLAATGASVSASGRGSLAGWTSCPLCGEFSKKKHALGRGIANHLKDVHTPWNPGKLAQKIHRRQYERRKRKYQHSRKRKDPSEADDRNCSRTGNQNESSGVSEPFKPLTSWTPTDDEKKAWAQKMLTILRKIEEEHITITSSSESNTDENKSCSTSAGKSEMKTQSQDKTGQKAIAYRDSLPPFLMAASKGDLNELQTLVDEAKEKGKKKTISQLKPNKNEQNDHHYLLTLFNTRDRHKSTAEHWAAGGGHLDCLRYLYNLRASLKAADNDNKTDMSLQKRRAFETSNTGNRNNKPRRRDGKTCLHYAARNGHINCIRYLLQLKSPEQSEDGNILNVHTVDERSGEGTTPLHLACYGGHPRAVKHLVEEFGADPHANNDWGCTSAHWAAMTLSSSEDDVKELCSYLHQVCGISFVETQGQGHTALHKAAHRRNAHVIRWMARSRSDGGAGLETAEKEKAGAPDQGGHKPSDIWKNMGGDAPFAEWMKSEMGW